MTFQKQSIDNKLKLNLALNNTENYIYFDLAGSGKSMQTIAAIDELELQHDEIILWCGYSKQDLYEKQTRFKNHKPLVVSSDNDDTECNIGAIDNHKIILMPVQFYRKFYPTDKLSTLGLKIKKVIIDELSYIDFLVPTLLEENGIFDVSADRYIKTKFSKTDYLNSKHAADNGDEKPFLAEFVSNDKLSHIILTTEYLTKEILSQYDYTIIEGDMNAQRDCTVKCLTNDKTTKKLIAWADMEDKWDSFGYDTIFCNSSNNKSKVVNHTLARGSNSFIGQSCLTIFRRYGTRFEFSFLAQMKKLFPNDDSMKYLKMFYTDSLNQTVSRTVGYRGDNIGYALMHDNCEDIIDTEIFPYKIVIDEEVEIMNKDKIESLIRKSNNISLEFLDDLVFDSNYKITVKELKNISGIPATKCFKLLQSMEYDVIMKRYETGKVIVGCKLK